MEANTVTTNPVSCHVLRVLVTLLFLLNTYRTLASNNTITTTTTTNSTQTYRTYIKTSCNSTTYPSICYKTLSPYASTIQTDSFKLCNISLSLALKATKSASSTISKQLKQNNLTSTEAQIVRDCIDEVKDSIDELLQSLDAMSHLEGEDKEFQIDNIKTWVSAAITDEDTCTDGFEEQNVSAEVKDKIRTCILDVARKTSNALYFINELS
ncbi:21 kDa protein [Quillaja saponaria]|uniref:21 kDa protein n=1 Tax=Quillaja saponaria TaxID=32244 RepID=A0AAD7L1B4_QUISA|nr:21 kDa protein [Quillaja saponaria]